MKDFLRVIIGLGFVWFVGYCFYWTATMLWDVFFDSKEPRP